MNVRELKEELDNFGDHLEVVVEPNDPRVPVTKLARVSSGVEGDGSVAVVLELE